MKITKKILTRNAAWVLIARENPSTYERSIIGIAKNSKDIFNLVKERILSEIVEVMYVVCIDGQNRVVALSEVSRGGLHGTSVGIKDILRTVIMSGASTFIMVHNHPSGNPNPSQEDIDLTQTVKKASEIVGLVLLDHVIVGSWEKYVSLLDLGIID